MGFKFSRKFWRKFWQVINLKIIFSELPKSIGESKKLKILELDENELTWLPADIGYCQQLQKLILTSNKISCLPTDIGSLKTLTHLYAGLSQSLNATIELIETILRGKSNVHYPTSYRNDEFAQRTLYQ